MTMEILHLREMDFNEPFAMTPATKMIFFLLEFLNIQNSFGSVLVRR